MALSNTQASFRLHVETVGKWIASCNKCEQLPICTEMVGTLIEKKFKPLAGSKFLDRLEFWSAVQDLREAIREQGIVLASHSTDNLKPSIFQLCLTMPMLSPQPPLSYPQPS